MRPQQPSNWLITLAIRTVKYFLLSVVGCVITYMASVVLEMGLITEVVTAVVEKVLARALILVLCLMVITAITESLRY